MRYNPLAVLSVEFADGGVGADDDAAVARVDKPPEEPLNES